MLLPRRFEMALTKEEVQMTNRSRTNNWNDCISAAKAGGYSVPPGQLAAVITWPDVDMWGSSGKGEAGPPLVRRGSARRPAQAASWAQPVPKLLPATACPAGAYLPWDVDVGGLAHECGHGLGLSHTFSNDPTYRNAEWAALGEYDDM